MKSYSTASTPFYTTKSKEPTIVRSVADRSLSLQTGSFVIVTHAYSGNAVKKNKRLVAVVISINSSDDKLNVCFGKALTKRRILLNESDEVVIQQNEVIQVLPCPLLRRGVYEFPEDLDIDI
ncbi:hypothetical protein LOD99_9392 [Oopsacas minuta]|uniref:Uncharacterized protein n=1 Tax=Oopsacas minuta TaxID=111878 RepID=A0AAV7JBP7_9METZ|nr:hypothetical protein LOD99_9392 [Oopsacas minuta]